MGAESGRSSTYNVNDCMDTPTGGLGQRKGTFTDRTPVE